MALQGSPPQEENTCFLPNTTSFQIPEVWLDLTHNSPITACKTVLSPGTICGFCQLLPLPVMSSGSRCPVQSLTSSQGLVSSLSYLLATITFTLIAWDKEGMGFMLSASSEVWIDIFLKNIFH